MKIEIDLNDILGDEFGTETIQESVRRQVIDKITTDMRNGIGNKINAEVDKIMNAEIRAVITERMPALIDDLMNAPYTPVSRYGDRDKPTTFRAELLKAINENMVYKKSTYSSENSPFTKAVDSVIEEQVKTFKKDFDGKVNETFTASAFEYATNALKKKLGIAA